MMKNPPHPGRGIKADIDELSLSVAEAAKAIGVTRQQLHRVIAGDCAISPEMAYRLEQAIGSTADAWLRLQSNHDLARVRERAATIQVTRLRRPEVA